MYAPSMDRSFGFRALLCLGVLCAVIFRGGLARGEPLAQRDVPEPLRPWIPWVVTGTEAERCPSFLGSEETRCVWPSRLSLTLGEKGGRFEQRFHVDAKAWVPLPGEETRFPLDVEAAGKKLVVVVREGVPSVSLEPGDHTVSGRFAWDSLPDSLAVPSETGILELSLSGARVPEPSRGEGGRVFLEKKSTLEEGERLEVLVHRRITDDVPLLLTTRITLNVAGKSREVVLGRSLPPGFVPMSITSDLPSRIEPDTRLRVQVRPGSWTLELTARSEAPVAELARPSPDGPWREGEEVWTFDARPALRLVSIEGVRAVDPQQTSLPESWRNLPAYSVGPTDRMTLAERRRGDVDPEPDQLTLERSLWLDFDGRGFTANDTITGTFHRAARLEMNPEMVLGRVAIDQRDQFITRGESGKAGVEVRQGPVRITADSRIPSGIRDIPAVGFDRDFHGVSETLHLPPGYRLFHVSGADEVPGTWIRHWTLLEIFLVLVLALAFAKLFGPAWGAISLVTFVLVFPEVDSPEWIWAVALAFVALVRVIPEGRVRRVFFGLELAVLLGLVLVTLPFLVQHVRQGIYPALGEPGGAHVEAGGFGFAGEPMSQTVAPAQEVTQKAAATVPLSPPPAEADQAANGNLAEQEEPEGGDADGKPAAKDDETKQKVRGALLGRARKAGGAGPSSSTEYRQFNAEVYDPNAMVQTGPGLPKWRWTTTSIRFSGPVERTQKFHLYLISPAANLFLSLVRALLVTVVFLRLLPKFPGNLRGRALTTAAVVSLALLGVARPAHAEIPSTEMLEQLKTRLLEPPDCLPNCATSPRMLLTARGDTLRARLEIAVAATTAVPLPGGASQWVPERVLVDGTEASGLVRGPEGALLLRLGPGLHDVVVEGTLPNRESTQIALPLKPHFVEADVQGFTLEGLHEDGVADDHLQLTRDHVDERPAAGGLAPGVLPPFVLVTRTLLIGLNWQVETRVTRLTPAGSAVVLEVPLLAGESVTTADIRVQASRVLVNMAPDESEVTWKSVLAERSPIELTAPRTTAWAELWRLDVSPIWHATPSGLAMVHGDAGARVPEWRPWPGESVGIKIARPPGVAGQTMTIDSAEIQIRPGLRAVDATATFTARSSRGAEHTVRLPEGAELESVSINGVSQPLRRQGSAVTMSFAPGAATVMVGYRVPHGITTLFRAPPFDFGAPAVNVTTCVSLSDARWILFVRGPRLGPAVLFWSLLLVLGLVSYGLGELRWVPVTRAQWMLLSLGLSQIPLPLAAVVVVWLLALGYRKRLPELPPVLFDVRQVALAVWTLVALAILVGAVHQGLMGPPDMQISGNGSYAGRLCWFDDRTSAVPEQPLVVSVPMLVYRLAMLLWALWLAISVLRWLRYAWTSFGTGGLWRRRHRLVPATGVVARAAPPPAQAAPGVAPSPEAPEPQDGPESP